MGAGTGGTTEAILPWLSDAGRVVAYEPAEAMRSMGQIWVRDPRVLWLSDSPQGLFHRIVCGAAIWQMLPLDRTLRALANRLSDEGALRFNIPSLYLGEPDESGGGCDPNLLGLPAVLGAASSVAETEPLPAGGSISDLFCDCDLLVVEWRFRRPLTQAEYRDWLKIPVLTNQWFATFDAKERARRIDTAFSRVDPDSWRWEVWTGWTAWRSPTQPLSFMSAHQPLTESQVSLSNSELA